MEEKWDHRGIPASDDGGPIRDQLNFSDMFPDNFPVGLRVLVFDEDPQHLLILEKYLQELHYEVTKCIEEERVMDKLCNHRNMFDIAIIEAQNSGGDRFQLIKKIGSEMDLPVIIMSQDDSAKSVITWMTNGACDYLIKPVRSEDVRLIFKHAVKKTRGRTSVAVVGEAEKEAAVGGEKSSSVEDYTIRNPNKRKSGIFIDAQVNEEDQDPDRDRASTSKKRRVVWDVELHKKFIEAVDRLGRANSVPKKILELMNVEGISRENVASHLQKYRMNLKKQKDQNEKDEKNQSLITPQEGRMYDGEQATEFYRGRIQFPTLHINNISQPSSMHQQQLTTDPNPLTQLISPLGHHDGVSVAVSGRNQVRTRQHHYQTSEFACTDNTEGSLGYNNFEMPNEDEAVIQNLTCLFTQSSEEAGFFQFQEPVMANTMIPSYHHHLSDSLKMMNVHDTEPSMLHVPSFPTSQAHSSFRNQQEMLTMKNESGGLNYNNGY